MLKIYHHTNLEILAHQFYKDIAQRPQEMQALESEYLITQTAGMDRWLRLGLARYQGVVSLLTTIRPTPFLMKLGFLLSGERETRSIFEKDILAWALVKIIQDELKAPGAPEGLKGAPTGAPPGALPSAPTGGLEILSRHVQKTLSGQASKGEAELRLLDLAGSLAEIYDDYMLYRPHWLDQWALGRSIQELEATVLDADSRQTELWQGELWRRVLDLAPHQEKSRNAFFNRIEQSMADALARAKAGGELPIRLPRRIFLFGMSVLPPRYIELFSKLSQLIPVHLYLQHPSWFFVDDLRTELQHIRLKLENSSLLRQVDTRSSFSEENILLSQWGGLSNQFINQLLSQDAELLPLYEFDNLNANENEQESSLFCIQESIRLCQALPPGPLDSSLVIAASPSPTREVEGLHDWLLSCFAENQELAPDDVLIVCPKPADYGPLVEMVFAQAPHGGMPLPVSISDSPQSRRLPIVDFLLALVRLLQGRMDGESFLSLFFLYMELKKVDLDIWQTEGLSQWCIKAGIRWGLHGEFKSSLGLPAEENGSWKWGLARLWAGWSSGEGLAHLPGASATGSATPMDAIPVAPPGALPAGPPLVAQIGATGMADGELLGELTNFYRNIEELWQFSRSEHRLATWISRLQQSLDEIMPEYSEFSEIGQQTSGAFNNLIERASIAGLQEQDLSAPSFFTLLIRELEGIEGSGRFLSGRITMAAIMPMRSLPFKIIAVLGLNQAAFPRFQQARTFHLMEQEGLRQSGDPNKLDGDRYLFLETILAAKEKLWLSWVESEKALPSILLDPFLAMAKEGIYRIPLHPFSLHEEHRQVLPTWDKVWTGHKERPILEEPMLVWRAPLAEDGQPSFRHIVEALSDPLVFFLQQGLGLDYPYEKALLEATEPFELDNLQKWQIRNLFIENWQAGELSNSQKDELKNSQLYYQLVQSSQLPYGPWGTKALKEHQGEMYQRMDKALSEHPDILGWERYKFQGLEVHRAVFNTEAPSCQVFSMAGKILSDKRKNKEQFRAKAIFPHWLLHLQANTKAAMPSDIYALDKTIHFDTLTKLEAVAHLAFLQKLAKRARTKILLFFPELGSYLFNKAESDNAWKKMLDPQFPDKWIFWRQKWWAEAENLDAWVEHQRSMLKTLKLTTHIDKNEIEELARDIWKPIFSAANIEMGDAKE